MDRAILEIGGTALVAATAFAATKFLVIAPFDRQYTAQQNSLIFVFVPTGIYVVFRIYFALSFYMCSKIRFPWIGECSGLRNMFILPFDLTIHFFPA